MTKRFLLALTLIGLLTAFSAQSFSAVVKTRGPEFQISFPSAIHSTPVTGRVFLFKPQRAEGTPWTHVWNRGERPQARRGRAHRCGRVRLSGEEPTGSASGGLFRAGAAECLHSGASRRRAYDLGA